MKKVLLIIFCIFGTVLNCYAGDISTMPTGMEFFLINNLGLVLSPNIDIFYTPNIINAYNHNQDLGNNLDSLLNNPNNAIGEIGAFNGLTNGLQYGVYVDDVSGNTIAICFDSNLIHPSDTVNENGQVNNLSLSSFFSAIDLTSLTSSLMPILLLAIATILAFVAYELVKKSFKRI